MNFKHIWIVFKKEMKDTFRDKKSVMTNILLPLIMIPALYFLMNMTMKGATKEVEENMKVGIMYAPDITQAETFTKENILSNVKCEFFTFTDEQEAKDRLMDGKINCLIQYPESFFENVAKGKATGVSLKYNSTMNSSQMTMQTISANIVGLNNKLAVQKLQEINVSPEILNIVSITSEDAYVEVSGNGQSSNMVLMMIVPMYLATIIVTAGMPLATDLFAGERERNTFEPLLSTKANRLSILLGKFMSVLVFSVIAIFTSFIGLILGIIISPEMFSTGHETAGIMSVLASINMPIGALLLALLSAITLAIVFGGIQIAVSTYSKSLKEAQTYLSYLMLGGMVPAFMTMFMGAGDMQFFMSFIPIFNTIASLKMVLGGVINYGFLLTGVIANLVFAGLVTAVVIRMFNNEKIVIK